MKLSGDCHAQKDQIPIKNLGEGLADYQKIIDAFFESHASSERKAMHKENLEKVGERSLLQRKTKPKEE
jgi:hypothetical protein